MRVASSTGLSSFRSIFVNEFHAFVNSTTLKVAILCCGLMSARGSSFDPTKANLYNVQQSFLPYDFWDIIGASLVPEIDAKPWVEIFGG